jgi:hypothetical protein
MRERLLFTAEAVAGVPEVTGVYILFRGQHPIYAGIAAGAATLRSELAARLSGALGINEATHFWWQSTGDALDAYRMQLAVYDAAAGA